MAHNKLDILGCLKLMYFGYEIETCLNVKNVKSICQEHESHDL